MKRVFIVFTERLGEAEGVFDEDDNLLDAWSCNDACWRNEYFCGFLQKLGILTLTREPTESQLEKMADYFGSELDE